MSNVTIHSLPIICKAYGLSVLTAHSEAVLTQAILSYDAPFAVQITLDFETSNAVALLALSPTIQVDFYVKPLQTGHTIDLGTSTLTTDSQQSLYTLRLEMTSPSELNLATNKVYRLGALVRIGASEQPALLCGVLEDLMVQIHTRKEASPAPKQSQKTTSKKRSMKIKK